MKPVFRKAAVYGDIHFGNKVNGLLHNQDCLDFTQWFVETAINNNCDVCIFVGDYFHNRNNTNLVTMNYGLRGLRLLSDSFERTIMLPGNHDLFYKDQRTISSIAWAEHIPNIEILNEITRIGDVTFAPWLMKNEHNTLFEKGSKYLFAHLEIPGCIMSGNMEMPDIGEFNANQFDIFEQVYTGHFHKRQNKKNITYIGNTFPHNFGDAGDDDRGMMILPWDEEPQFLSWPDAPKYRVVKISDLVTDPAKYLPEFGYIKLVLDTDISYSEASYLKENLIEEFSLRELSLVPTKKDLHAVDLSHNGNINFQSVNEIVLNQITDIKSEFYDNNILLDIYRGL